MAPEIEETTPDAVETTPEAPPVATEPDATEAESPDAPVNELADFRAARKAEREGVIPDEEAPPTSVEQGESDEAAPAAVSATAEEEPGVPQENQIVDPDTGDVLDRRSRAGRRIKALLQERYILKQQMAQLTQQQGAPAAEETPDPAKMHQVETPDDPNDPAPLLEQFSEAEDPYAAFLASNSRWEARQEFKKQAYLQSAASRTAQAESQVNYLQNEWDGKLKDVRERLSDFDAAYDEMYQALPTNGDQRTLVETLLTSPIGHDLAHYLGSHPTELQKLFNKQQYPTLREHIRAIGKIEARVESTLEHAQKPTQLASTHVATPAPPMNPVGGGATPTGYDSRSATLAQFRKHNGVRGGRRSV